MEDLHLEVPDIQEMKERFPFRNVEHGNNTELDDLGVVRRIEG